MVFLTGGAFTARAQKFLSEGARVVVDKPFVVDELREVIGRRLAAFDAKP